MVNLKQSKHRKEPYHVSVTFSFSLSVQFVCAFEIVSLNILKDNICNYKIILTKLITVIQEEGKIAKKKS